MTPQEKHDKILIENKPFFDKRLIEQGKQEERQRLAKEIKNIKNPYPKDVFPKVELNEFQSHTINDFLCSHLRITLDGFSAELMRRARDELKKEVLALLSEEKGK